jgi:hypothetical protein
MDGKMIIEKWKNVQTYEIGKMHISRGMVCQDRTFYAEANGVKAVALADGAGSKSKSEIGAEIVCKKICDLLSEKFIDYLLCFEEEKTNQAKHKKNMAGLSKVIVTALMTTLKAKALELNISVEELSSTLLFFAIKDNHYIMGHIGDGVIAGVYNENNAYRVKVISEPENGERSNITFFIPDTNAAEHLHLQAGSIDNLKGVLLTSDGAGTVLFNGSAVDDNVYKLFSNFQNRKPDDYEEIISRYLREIISNYSTDDLSLNILTLEDADTGKITEDYAEYLLAGIKSSKQIIRKSQYCYFVDPSISATAEFASLDEVKEYMKWR